MSDYDVPPSPNDANLSYQDEQTNKTESRTGIHVIMELSAETVIEIGFIREYFSLQTHAEAVALASSICVLLLNEMKRGSIIVTQDKSGVQSKLVVGRKEDESNTNKSRI